MNRFQRQRGQTLVLAMALIFMGAIGLFWIFNTGQVSADKQRVTNTADAVAYSSAVWRARSLNFDAYANRAMIANDVAIAQTMTLMSEIQYLKNLMGCLGLSAEEDNNWCFSVASYVLAYFGLSSAFSTIQQVLSYIDDGALPPLAALEATLRSSGINAALQIDQNLMDAATNSFAVEATIARDVVKANDVQFSALVVADRFGLLNGFTKVFGNDSVGSTTERVRMAEMTKALLDPYSKDRSMKIVVIPRWLNDCQIVPEFEKYGSTSLSLDFNNWEAADTFSEWIGGPRRFSLRRGFYCPNVTENPYAWGDRQTNGPTDDVFLGASPERNARAMRTGRQVAADNQNSNASSGAYDGSSPGGRQVTGYAGIPSFRDLNYASLSSSNSSDAEVKNPSHILTVMVWLNKGDLRTANNLNIGTGRLRMTENMDKDRVKSIASAEVFFKRPVPRDPSATPFATEYPSLFNPYWQARLAQTPVADYAIALAQEAALH
jgi:hypothetical protein